MKLEHSAPGAWVPYSVRANVRRAIEDPGSIVGDRNDGPDWREATAHWRARAVMEVIMHEAARSPHFAQAMRLSQEQRQALYAKKDLHLLRATGLVGVHELTADGEAARRTLEIEQVAVMARRMGDRLRGKRLRVRDGFVQRRLFGFWARIPRPDLHHGHIWFHSDDDARLFVEMVTGPGSGGE